MKKLIYLLLLPLALTVVACGGKNGSSNKESVLATQDSVDAHGLQRMQSSKAETDIKFKGKDYHSLVSRTPDESLPHVSNEMPAHPDIPGSSGSLPRSPFLLPTAPGDPLQVLPQKPSYECLKK